MTLVLDDILYDEISLTFGTQLFDRLEVRGLLQLLDLLDFLSDLTLLICVVIAASSKLEELLLFFRCLILDSLLPLFLYVVCRLFRVLSSLLQFLLVQFLFFCFFFLPFTEFF